MRCNRGKPSLTNRLPVRWTVARFRLDGRDTIILLPTGKQNANRIPHSPPVNSDVHMDFSFYSPPLSHPQSRRIKENNTYFTGKLLHSAANIRLYYRSRQSRGRMALPDNGYPAGLSILHTTPPTLPPHTAWQCFLLLPYALSWGPCNRRYAPPVE